MFTIYNNIIYTTNNKEQHCKYLAFGFHHFCYIYTRHAFKNKMLLHLNTIDVYKRTIA